MNRSRLFLFGCEARSDRDVCSYQDLTEAEVVYLAVRDVAGRIVILGILQLIALVV